MQVQNYLHFPLCFTYLCANIFCEPLNGTAETNNGSYILRPNSHNALHRRPSTSFPCHKGDPEDAYDHLHRIYWASVG